MVVSAPWGTDHHFMETNCGATFMSRYFAKRNKRFGEG